MTTTTDSYFPHLSKANQWLPTWRFMHNGGDANRCYPMKDVNQARYERRCELITVTTAWWIASALLFGVGGYSYVKDHDSVYLSICIILGVMCVITGLCMIRIPNRFNNPLSVKEATRFLNPSAMEMIETYERQRQLV